MGNSHNTHNLLKINGNADYDPAAVNELVRVSFDYSDSAKTKNQIGCLAKDLPLRMLSAGRSQWLLKGTSEVRHRRILNVILNSTVNSGNSEALSLRRRFARTIRPCRLKVTSPSERASERRRKCPLCMHAV